jgi:hypothetical protein
MLNRRREKTVVKLNRGALKFCGVYTIFFILMAWAGHSANNGNGDSFFSQLAIMPVFAPLTWSGLLEFIPPGSWMDSVFFFFPFCLVIVYFIGWAISGFINFKDPSAPVADDPPDWHKR